MVWAVVFIENADIVATYDSRAAAEGTLAKYIGAHPHMVDDVGLRPYEDGRPAGEWEPASDVLADQIAQQQLVR
jgi:hypothetical protein